MSKYMEAFKSLYGEEISPSLCSPTKKSRSPHCEQQRKPRRNIEAGLQMRLVAWALGEGLPVFSIPNEGDRGRIATARLKQMGLRPGASDLFLARRSCCGSWPGYFIEMKAPGERPRPNQIAFMQDMRKEAFRAEWFDDWLIARQSIIEYLGLDKK
jgi:VRR-NUC domain